MRRAPVALLLIAAMPLASQEPSKEAEAPELAEYKDASGNVILRLPKTWKVKPEPGVHEEIIINLRITIPGERQKMLLEVNSLPGVALRTEAQAWYGLPSPEALSASKAPTVRSEPVTHILADIDDGDPKQKRITVIGIRRFRCRGIHVRLTGTKKAWDRPNVQAVFFNLVQGVECNLPRWPGIPVKEDGYKIVKRDGLVFYIQHGVSEKGGKRIENFVCSMQKRFVKVHGAIKRPADEPPLIFIHRDVATHAHFSKEAAETQEGMHVQTRARRVFALGYEGSSRHPEAVLAHELTRLFLAERYGIEAPSWFHWGESFLAYTREWLGKSLPYVTQDFADERPKMTAKLTELQHLAKNKVTDYYLNGKAYCAFFHAGPSKYRRAYRAFLKEFAETCNYRGAVHKHLYSLDQNEMYRELRRFLEKRLRPLKAE